MEGGQLGDIAPGCAQTALAGASEPRDGPAMTSRPVLKQPLRARAPHSTTVGIFLSGLFGRSRRMQRHDIPEPERKPWLAVVVQRKQL